jgi:glycine cleavage system H protein
MGRASAFNTLLPSFSPPSPQDLSPIMDRSQLKYAKTHEWVALEGDVATVGISDFAVQALTDLVYIDLPPVGRKVTAGETFGEVESVKAVSDLYAPITGEVIEINQQLPDNLALLSDDPFGAGWMLKVKVPGGTSLDHLLDAAAYQKFCESEAH